IIWSGSFDDLDLEASEGRDPGRVACHQLAHCLIDVRWQIRPAGMWNMEAQENAGVVNWLAAAVANRTSKPELKAQHTVVELLCSVEEDGMISNGSLYPLIVDESRLAWLSDQHTIDESKAARTSRLPPLKCLFGASK